MAGCSLATLIQLSNASRRWSRSMATTQFSSGSGVNTGTYVRSCTIADHSSSSSSRVVAKSF